MGASLDELPGWLPNALTASRLVWTGLGYWAALRADRLLLTVFIVTAVASDVFDGPLARRLGRDGDFGSQLDTAVDAGFYSSLLAWVYMLEPDILLFQEMGPVVAVFAVLVVLSLVAGRLRTGRMGFHTSFTRASATAGVVATVWTIQLGFEPWLVYGLVVVLSVDLAHRFLVLVRNPEGVEPWTGGERS